MRELIDMITVYIALGMGFIAIWYGLFSGGDLTSSVVRALWCCFCVLVIGLAAKALWLLAGVMGNISKTDKPKSCGEGEESDLQDDMKSSPLS